MNSAEDWGTIEDADAETSGEAEERVAPRTTADWGRSVTTYIGENPEVCLAVALALGAAIGLAVKRR